MDVSAVVPIVAVIIGAMTFAAGVLRYQNTQQQKQLDLLFKKVDDLAKKDSEQGAEMRAESRMLMDHIRATQQKHTDMDMRITQQFFLYPTKKELESIIRREIQPITENAHVTRVAIDALLQQLQANRRSNLQ